MKNIKQNLATQNWRRFKETFHGNKLVKFHLQRFDCAISRDIKSESENFLIMTFQLLIYWRNRSMMTSTCWRFWRYLPWEFVIVISRSLRTHWHDGMLQFSSPYKGTKCSVFSLFLSAKRCCYLNELLVVTSPIFTHF